MFTVNSEIDAASVDQNKPFAGPYKYVRHILIPDWILEASVIIIKAM